MMEEIEEAMLNCLSLSLMMEEIETMLNCLSLSLMMEEIEEAMLETVWVWWWRR